MLDDDLDLVYTRKTDESGPTNRKLNEARDLKINILNEKDWNKLINK